VETWSRTVRRRTGSAARPMGQRSNRWGAGRARLDALISLVLEVRWRRESVGEGEMRRYVSSSFLLPARVHDSCALSSELFPHDSPPSPSWLCPRIEGVHTLHRRLLNVHI
jgi:hypothetical protein